MCRRITCSTCGKPSFSGCGQHVESVLADVPPAERCRCRPVAPAAESKPAKPGVLRRLLGRLG